MIDKLVMVDDINGLLPSGESLWKVSLKVGVNRCHTNVLSLVTLLAGLVPLMLDQSLQPECLVPVAVLFACGLRPAIRDADRT